MTLIKYKLGDLIEIYDEQNSNDEFTVNDVKGVSIQKKFIKSKANMKGVSLKPYKCVRPDCFVYVTVTSRNGKKITLAYNESNETYIVSSSYVVFKIIRKDILLSAYLFMYFNRPEFDRYSRFNSWGSARETFMWEDMCDIDIELPPIEIQQKYVDIYNTMKRNQKVYEKGLNDLKFACNAYIDNLDSHFYKPVGKYIERNKKRNHANLFSKNDVKGFNNEGEFIKPMRLFSGDITKFKIISKHDFVYNSRINSTIHKLSVAMNEGNDLIVSPAYESFTIINEKQLYPYYLYMLLQRESFARKVLFNSFGSSTLVFGIDDLNEIELPIPNIEIQKDIANIYKTYKARWTINERLKEMTKKICPILIKGSIEEGRNT